MPNTHWSNRLSFIITTSAFAIGLGNIWRFPYMVGEGGGGAFLLVYLVLIFLIGIPLLTIEIGLGRMAATTPLLGFGKISQNHIWNIIGWIAVIGMLLIWTYYVMIMTWISIYTLEFVNGNILQLNSSEIPSHFNGVVSNTSNVMLGVLALLGLCLYILSRGLQAGLERYSKIMMIGLFVLLFSLSIWALTLDAAAEGLRWYLTPDFSKISLNVALNAMGQLFFSIGVGMAVAFTFGSYTDKKDNLITSTAWIVFADSFVAVLAGFIIFPALFSFNLSPDSGPNLIFVTMATAFGSFDNGQWVGALFFFLLFLAGLTSLLGGIQGIADSIKDKFRISSLQSLMIVIAIIFLGSIPVILSYSENPFLLNGHTVYESLDFLTNSIILPIGGLLVVLFGAYIVGYENLIKQLSIGAENINIGKKWKPLIKWIIPAAIIIILINGLT